MIDVPLTRYEEGALDHLLGCPAENTINSLYGWSTFGPCALDEETKVLKRRRVKRALAGLVRKDYATGGGDGPYEATDLAYFRHDYERAVRARGSSTRTVTPEDLSSFTFEQDRRRSWDKPSQVTVRALCRLDALDLAVERLSRRGIHNDDFRSQLIRWLYDERYSLPMSREAARGDLSLAGQYLPLAGAAR